MAGRENFLREEQTEEGEIDRIGSDKPMESHVLVGTSEVHLAEQKNILPEEHDTDRLEIRDFEKPMASHVLAGTSKVHLPEDGNILPAEQVVEPEIDLIDSEEPMASHILAATSEVHLSAQGNISPEEQVAEPEIELRDSEEPMASPVLVRQNPIKLLHLEYQLYLISRLVICVCAQYFFGSDGMVVGFVSTVETGMLLLVVVLDLSLLVWLYSTWSQFSGVKTYLRTAALVLQDYALLITLNRKYIEIAIIPFTIFVFIYALASKVSKQPRGEFTLGKGLTKSAKGLKEMAMVPYVLQLMLMVYTQFMGKVEKVNMFIFSSFLLFLCSALCSLTVMIASTPIGIRPGVIQVVPAMHKASTVLLMITAHSMAAEWAGEDIVFACVPEITSVLVWFTVSCHHPKHAMIINKATSHGSRDIVILSSVGAILARFAPLYAKDMIDHLRPWLVSVFWISSSSSVLCYLDVWLLDRWPAGTGSTPNPQGEGLVQLLKFYTRIGFCVSICMICANPRIQSEAFRYKAIAGEMLQTFRSVVLIVAGLSMSLMHKVIQKRESLTLHVISMERRSWSIRSNDNHHYSFAPSTIYPGPYDDALAVAHGFVNACRPVALGAAHQAPGDPRPEYGIVPHQSLFQLT